jgi:2-dehydropantoate 2-reductase
MQFLVYGTGAVGGYLGARLARGGQQVRFLARPAWARVLGAEGLRLVDANGASVVYDFSVSSSLAEVAEGVDVALVAVKAYDCEQAAAELAKALAPGVPVVSFQNGIGGEEILGATLGPARVLAASLTTAVQADKPGTVRVQRERGLGLEAGHAVSFGLQEIFASSGVRTRLYPRPAAMKWSKLLTNIVANATSAILGWTAAEVMNHPGTFRLEIEALREAVRVMRKLGWKPVSLPGVPVGLLGRGVFLPPAVLRPLLGRVVARGRGAKLPSLHADIGRGRSEVHWLNGAVVEHGRRAGIETPANNLLTSVFDGIVRGSTPPESYRSQPDRLLSEAARAGVPGSAGYNRPR